MKKNCNIKNIQILGPYNSGSNLLSIILNNNINRVRINPIETNNSLLIWKHEIEESKLVQTIKSRKDTLFICIYKPLYNWIYSILNSPYEIRWNKNIKSNCSFLGIKYNNIIEIYNKYYKNYMKLIKNFDNVIFLKYYDFISKNSIKYINDRLFNYNLKLNKINNINNILNKPGKNHGKSVSSANEALKNRNINSEKIKDKDFIQTVYNNDITIFFNKF